MFVSNTMKKDTKMKMKNLLDAWDYDGKSVLSYPILSSQLHALVGVEIGVIILNTNMAS